VRGLILALAACVVIGVASYALLGGVGMKSDMAMVKESARVVTYSAPMPGAAESRSYRQEREGGAPASTPDASYAHLGTDSPFTSVPPPASIAAPRARAAAELQAAPLERPLALAANKPQPEMKAKQMDASRGTVDLPAESAPEMASRTDTDFIAPAGGAVTDGSLTAGNRSGDAVITGESIDAILNSPARPAELKEKNESATVLSGVVSGGAAVADKKMAEEVGQVAATAELEDLALQLKPGSAGDEPVAANRFGFGGGVPQGPASGQWYGLTREGADKGANNHLDPAAPLAEDEVRERMLKEVDRAWDLPVPLDGTSAQEGQNLQVKGKPGAAVPDDALGRTALAEEGAAAVDEVRRKLSVAEGNQNLGKLEDAQKAYEEILQVDPSNQEARRGMEEVAAAKSDYFRAAKDHTRSEPLMEATDVSPERKKQIALDLMSEVASADEPFSTFSLHVSDASFKLAQAAMERGEVPAAEGIRPEEFYNAFDYGDPAPASGEPVVCVTEQSAHPAFAQRNLLRIGVRTGSQGRGASTPLNLTLLLDHSGSMEREDRNAGLAMAVRQLSVLLKEGDTITVAGFSRQPRLLADRLPGARAQELNELIARTPSEGGTNLEEGLKLGEELAKRQFNPAAQNRVVLFTDGAANLGDARPEALQARIEGLRQQGIAFDAAGFGADGLNDKLLERLTRNGNGRYYVVDGPEDADAGFAKQLAGAFRPAAENVKVQVRFNPARVAKYKLIGFEEHRLQKEDFRNDAVDAAEMAAEEAGNALYQIETLPQGEGEVGEVSVRFRDVASGQMVERTWTIPYDAQAPAFDKATPSIQLAGLAAFTAEKLRAAPMADAVDFQQLGQVYAGVRARYPNSQPVADLGSMIGKMK
jgi:secreted protein with Ig-like and vWFA domain